MWHVGLRLWALLVVLGATLLWDCRGKEGPQGPVGPQGPSGQNLTRTQQGYIRGTVKGRDTTRNQNFQLSFDYTYVPAWFGYPGFWEPQAGQPDTIEIFLAREGEKGGSLSLNLYRLSDGRTIITSLYGEILDISGANAARYSLSYPAFFYSDTAYITNPQLRGDSLISGTLYYIRPKGPNHPADTLKAEFESRILRLIPYQRVAQPSSFQTQSVQ